LKISRKKQNMRRMFYPRPESICPNCNKPGRHFAPPSLGEPGFYICDEKTNVPGEPVGAVAETTAATAPA